MKQRRFVALDRDGTIIEERHYLSDPEGVTLLPHAINGLRRLRELGLGLVVITNQSAIGRGFFDIARLELIHQRLCDLLTVGGIHFDGIYFCPHVPDDRCLCRKPEPGLLRRAASDCNFDPSRAFVIGDKACDIALGQQIGATTLLVRTGYGAQAAADGTVTPDYVVDNLGEAAVIIERLLADEEKEVTDGAGY
jgi:D-glycero-D-manno-heptose 1,7-bisphosphate phosphatase